MMPASSTAPKVKTSNESPNSQDTGTSSGDATPDQRPTRPLDLDVERNQNPAANIKYIRHLGLVSQEHGESQDQNDDWVWLNLLISMAQLHTMNVTPEFIRLAVSKLSTKFELSSDGRKIRWKGGSEGTRLTSESEGSSAYIASGSSPDDETTSEENSNKRRKLVTDGMMEVESGTSAVGRIADEQHSGNSYKGNWPRPATLATQPTVDSLVPYQPVVYSRDHTKDDSAETSGSSYDEASGLKEFKRPKIPASLISGRGSSSGDGPMIFYKNPYFCMDLSCDRQSLKRSRESSSVSSRASDEVLGLTRSPSSDIEKDTTSDFHTLASEGDSVSSEMELGEEQDFDDSQFDIEPLQGHDERILPKFVDFEASGLGGVMPEDNFGIRVKINRRPVAKGSPVKRIPGIPLHRPPPLKRFESTISSVETTNLKSSELPAPSFVIFSSSSGSDDVDDDDSDDSSDKEDSDEASSSDEAESDVGVNAANRSPPAPASFLKEFSSMEESMAESNETSEISSSENTGPVHRKQDADADVDMEEEEDEEDEEDDESSIDSTVSEASS